MNWWYKLLERIHPNFQKWYNFFGNLEWTEDQKKMMAEWTKALPPVVSAALLFFVKKWYAEYVKEKTNDLIDRVTREIDKIFS